MKSIKHVWSVLCKHSIIDNETNNINLEEVLERLQVDVGIDPKNPKALPEKVTIPFGFEIVTLWARKNFEDKNERKVDVKIEIIDPSGKKISEMINNFVLAPNFRRMRGRARSGNIVLTTSGLYMFKISGKEFGEKDFEIEAELPLEVEILKKNVGNKVIN